MTALITIILFIIFGIYIIDDRFNKHNREFSDIIRQASNYIWVDLRPDAIHDLYVNGINEGTVDFVYHDTKNIWFIRLKNGKAYNFHLLCNYNSVAQGLVITSTATYNEIKEYESMASLKF